MREKRPWGYFELLYETAEVKCKRLLLNAGQRISLQRHRFRDEYWVIVEGKGLIQIGQEEKEIRKGDFFQITKGTVHRVQNHSKQDLIIIETQLGFCDENDIERLEDDWNRHLKGADE